MLHFWKEIACDNLHLKQTMFFLFVNKMALLNLKIGNVPEICYAECTSVISWYNFTESQEQLCVKNTESDFK